MSSVPDTPQEDINGRDHVGNGCHSVHNCIPLATSALEQAFEAILERNSPPPTAFN